MNLLVPLVFSSVILSADTDRPYNLNVGDNNQIETWTDLCSEEIDGKTLVTSEILTSNGGSRRVMAIFDADGTTPIDVLDAGPWEMEGFLNNMYFTDKKSETITAWFHVDDSSPSVSEAPEGGKTIEFTDRITLTALNHDTDEKESYTIRDNQVIYKVDSSGIFSLFSIRPKSNDMNYITRNLLIYNTDKDTENPLSSSELTSFISSLFPIPARIPVYSQDNP